MIILVIMVIADGILTNLLIKHDIAREANPFLVNLAGNAGLIIFKIAGMLVVVAILWDIYRRSPRLAFIVSAVSLTIYVAIVAWNLHLLLSGLAAGI